MAVSSGVIVGKTGAVIAESTSFGWRLQAGALKGREYIILFRFNQELMLIYQENEESYCSARSSYYIFKDRLKDILEIDSQVDFLAEEIKGEDESYSILEGELEDILNNCTGPESLDGCDDCSANHMCQDRFL